MNELTEKDSNLQNVSMQEMEELDLDMITNLPWAQTCWQQIEKNMKKGFLNWCKILNSLAGPKEALMKQWSDSYTQAIDEILCEMVMEVLHKHNSTIDSIQQLLKKLESICNQLHEPIPQSIGEKGLCLFDEKEQLCREIEQFQSKLNAKKEVLLKLNEKQQKLCRELGVVPKVTLQYPPLPTPAQLREIEKNIEDMEADKFEREEQYCHLKTEIVKIVEEIGFKPENVFEKMVLSTDVHEFSITRDNMEKLENLNHQLKTLKKTTEEDIVQLRSRLEDLWKMLDTPECDRDDFNSKHTDFSLDCLGVLRNEVKKYEELRKSNIKDIVEKLRKQLEELWEKCHSSVMDRRSFKHFDNDCYTEDLLDLHDLEIRKWREYFERNAKLIGLLDKHDQLWNKAIELEENATGANRFKNRGGKLLQEERERNKLSKLIPKIEEEIIGLSAGSEFRTHGRTVEEYIEHVHAERENARKVKQIKTPSKKPSGSITTTPRTPATTPRPPSAAKRKILATPIDNKRQRMNSGSSTKSRSSPKKAVLATRVLPSQRRKSRRKSNSKNIPTIQVQNSTYCDFENDLSNRGACQSSILPDQLTAGSSGLPNLPRRLQM